MKNTEPKIVVAAKLKEDIPGLLTQTDIVVAGIEGHPQYFPNPSPDMPTVKAARKALADSHTSGSSIKGGAKQRNPKERQLRNLLLALARYVEACANADLANGPAIVAASGFTERAKSTRTKAQLNLSFRGVSGTIEADAKAPKGRAFYHWRFSVDAGATWVEPTGTNVSKTSISGLPVGKDVLVQVSITQKSVRGPWSDSASILVQ